MDGTNPPAGQTFRAAAIWTAVVAGVLLLWVMRGAILLMFGALLLSMLLKMLSGAICRVGRLSGAWGLFLATAAALGLIGICLWLFSSNLTGQLHAVMLRGQEGFEQIRQALHHDGVNLPPIKLGQVFFDDAIPNLISFAMGLAEVVIILAVMAIYLAAEPRTYRKGLAALFPARLTGKGMEAMHLIGSSLQLWMLGQLILMLLVGVLSYIALLVIGLPNPGALATIAGITEIIPYLGPFIGAVPAVLVALTLGLVPALWTMLLYLGIHFFEGYLVGPLLQRWFVRIPPALILASIFAAQLLFGFFGVLLAAPIAVALFAAVKVFYVRNTLEQAADLPDKLPF